ncbi:hypothetical protein QYE76_044384 [Lolium multiflorum]|uniref:KIB1-4 beta-propeller domain-containing protein n=1 Tax=Lolium multiflorum TaxID=4521 RepID=A0AAD8WYT5_LOLMU|nr:hypothetical protein QYE76_044384 [Lolium multiflorum]
MEKKNAPAAVASEPVASAPVAETSPEPVAALAIRLQRLPEPDVHLDEWIMLDHALPHVAEFTFLQLGTSRYVTIDLSEVHTRYYFVGFCRGVIVLAQKNPPHKIRLLNPLTKKSNTMFEAQMPSVFLKSVAVIKSPTMVFVTAHYPSEIGWVDESTPTKDIDKDWEKRFSIKNHCLRCITPFNGELYALAVDNLEHGRIVCTNVQLQQRASTVKMETLISFPELGHQKFYLVKSDGDLLLVLLVSVALAGRPLVYRVDTQSRSLHPVSNIGSNAFFVNYIRCISVDTRVYPTLRPGCIYYTDLGYIREYSHDTKAWDEWAVRVDRIGNYAIRVPQWGSCEKVRGTPRELSNLYTMICHGRSFSDDGGKISSIQLPAIRYFAYFVTKCVLARKNARKGGRSEIELNAYIEREGHHARDGTEEAEEHPDSSSDAASSSYQHYGHVEPPRHSSAQGPYYHSMYDPPAWNPDPRWE